MGDYYDGVMNENTYINNYPSNNPYPYRTFKSIENASRYELNKFIKSVTKAGNSNESGLLSQNNVNITAARQKLFLCGANSTEAQRIFGFNVLVYLGDIYQKKVLPPHVRSNNLSTSYPIDNPDEINFEDYIYAIINIYNALTSIDFNDVDEDVELLIYLTVFELYDELDIDSDEPQNLLDIGKTVVDGTEIVTDIKATEKVKEIKARLNEIKNSQSETFIGYRQIDGDKSAVKEGFVSMGKEAAPNVVDKAGIREEALSPSSEYAMDYKRLYDALPVGFYGNKTKAQTIKQAISIDSRHRDNYYATLSTDYTFNMPERQNNVIQMSIIAIEMPMTFYSISNNRGNSTMVILSDAAVNYAGARIADLAYVGASGEAIVGFKPVRCAWRVRLSDGNYDTRSWMSTKTLTEISMNDAIMLASPGAVDESGRFFSFAAPAIGDGLNSRYSDDDINDIRFKINNINGKSVFASQITTNVGVNAKRISRLRFNVDNDGNLDTNTNIQMRLGWALGFRAAEYVMGAVSPVTASTPISAVSEGVGFISSIRYGYLSIEEYQNNGHPPLIVAFNDHIIDKKIMTRICLAPIKLGHDLTSRETGFITHRRTPREYYNAVNIDKLTIKLFDEYGRIIDLNNMDWSLTMEFVKLY
tara:strand:- start:328 stop:2259 length:1932 start_codon:yes stop_codon:yes gene_type:complete